MFWVLILRECHLRILSFWIEEEEKGDELVTSPSILAIYTSIPLVYSSPFLFFLFVLAWISFSFCFLGLNLDLVVALLNRICILMYDGTYCLFGLDLDVCYGLMLILVSEWGLELVYCFLIYYWVDGLDVFISYGFDVFTYFNLVLLNKIMIS